MARERLDPRDGVEGRYNFKRFVRIERDGSVERRTRLQILDKRRREEVICAHFLNFVGEYLIWHRDFQMVSRDKPWDFDFNVGGKRFGVEIVSVADSAHEHEVNLREEWRNRLAYESDIPMRTLSKIARLFPDDELDRTIASQLSAGVRADDLVANPDFPSQPKVYVSSASDRPSVGHLFASAIRSKERKPHVRKGQTVLIIDNRTSLSYLDEFMAAIGEVTQSFASSPFAEIWVYTGYCSDWNGENGQATFAAIKISQTFWPQFGEPRRRDTFG